MGSLHSAQCLVCDSEPKLGFIRFGMRPLKVRTRALHWQHCKASPRNRAKPLFLTSYGSRDERTETMTWTDSSLGSAMPNNRGRQRRLPFVQRTHSLKLRSLRRRPEKNKHKNSPIKMIFLCMNPSIRIQLQCAGHISRHRLDLQLATPTVTSVDPARRQRQEVDQESDAFGAGQHGAPTVESTKASVRHRAKLLQFMSYQGQVRYHWYMYRTEVCPPRQEPAWGWQRLPLSSRVAVRNKYFKVGFCVASRRVARARGGFSPEGA